MTCYSLGVIQLDFAMEIEFEPEEEEGIPTTANWSMRDLFEKVHHKEKPLFDAIVLLEGGTVMAIVCTGGRQDEKLTNTTLAITAWAMYNLLLVYNTTTRSIEAALGAWFSIMHKTTAIK